MRGIGLDRAAGDPRADVGRRARARALRPPHWTSRWGTRRPRSAPVCAEALGVIAGHLILNGPASGWPRAATAGLVLLLKDGDPDVRLAAMRALERIAGTTGASRAIADLPAVVVAFAAMPDDSDDDVRYPPLVALFARSESPARLSRRRRSRRIWSRGAGPDPGGGRQGPDLICLSPRSVAAVPPPGPRARESPGRRGISEGVHAEPARVLVVGDPGSGGGPGAWIVGRPLQRRQGPRAVRSRPARRRRPRPGAPGRVSRTRSATLRARSVEPGVRDLQGSVPGMLGRVVRRGREWADEAVAVLGAGGTLRRNAILAAAPSRRLRSLTRFGPAAGAGHPRPRRDLARTAGDKGRQDPTRREDWIARDPREDRPGHEIIAGRGLRPRWPRWCGPDMWPSRLLRAADALVEFGPAAEPAVPI